MRTGFCGTKPKQDQPVHREKDDAATVHRGERASHERHLFEELLAALHEENEADMDDEEQPEML